MIILLTRVIKYGLQNFWRNGLLSSATIAVMVLTLALCIGLMIFGAGANTTLQSLQEKIDISVYFKIGADEARIFSMKKSVESLPEVKSVEYISSDQSLERFKEKHKNDSAILQSLEELGNNPLPASLNIKAGDPRNYAGIASYLDSDAPKDIIDKINYSENQLVIDRLTKIIKTLRSGGIALAIILAAVAFLVAFNTIRLAIFSNRESIEIMRLVGASNSLIRGPYVIEGIIHGAIATIITTVLFIPLIHFINPYFKIIIPEFGAERYFWSHFFGIFGIQLLLGSFLGVASSLIAMRKYLKI